MAFNLQDFHKTIDLFKSYCDLQIDDISNRKTEIETLEKKLQDAKYSIANRNPDTNQPDEIGKVLVDTLDWEIKNHRIKQTIFLLTDCKNELLRQVRSTEDMNLKTELQGQLTNIEKKLNELLPQQRQLESSPPKINLSALGEESANKFRHYLHNITPTIEQLVKLETEESFETSSDYYAIKRKLGDLENSLGSDSPTNEQIEKLDKLVKDIGWSKINYEALVKNIHENETPLTPELPVLEPLDFKFTYGDRNGLKRLKELTEFVNQDLKEIEAIKRYKSRNPQFKHTPKVDEKYNKHYQSLKKHLNQLKELTNDLEELLPTHPECKKFTEKLNKLLQVIMGNQLNWPTKKINKMLGRREKTPGVKVQEHDPNLAKTLDEEQTVYLWVQTGDPRIEVTSWKKIPITGEDGKPMKLPKSVIQEAVAEFNSMYRLTGKNKVTIHQNNPNSSKIKFPKNMEQQWVEHLKRKYNQFKQDKEKNKEIPKDAQTVSAKMSNENLLRDGAETSTCESDASATMRSSFGSSR